MSPSTLQFNIVKSTDASFVTVFVSGQEPLSARSDNTNYDKIIVTIHEIDKLDRDYEAWDDTDRAAVQELSEFLVTLFDLTDAIAAKFENLSERIAVKNGHVYVDGDPVDDRLTQHIISAYEEGSDFAPLVAFYENLLANPLGHAREALYPWIERNPLTITEDGMVVGYKSVTRVEEDGEVYYQPSRAGAGIVNGVPVPANRHIRQQVGDVVEMPRSTVLFAPSQACGEGLHIGDWTYAENYTGDTVLEVHFNPRDVVSVPNDQNKIRVRRYEVIAPVTKAHSVAVLHPENEVSATGYGDALLDIEPEYCDDCGEPEDECYCGGQGYAPYDDEDDIEPEYCDGCGELESDCGGECYEESWQDDSNNTAESDDYQYPYDDGSRF